MVTDWLGTEIRPGSVIVYPGRQGSSMWMNRAKVHSTYTYITDSWNWAIRVSTPVEHTGLIVWVEQTNYKGEYVSSRSVKLTRLDRVTVVG